MDRLNYTLFRMTSKRKASKAWRPVKENVGDYTV